MMKEIKIFSLWYSAIIAFAIFLYVISTYEISTIIPTGIFLVIILIVCILLSPKDYTIEKVFDYGLLVILILLTVIFKFLEIGIEIINFNTRIIYIEFPLMLGILIGAISGLSALKEAFLVYGFALIIALSDSMLNMYPDPLMLIVGATLLVIATIVVSFVLRVKSKIP